MGPLTQSISLLRGVGTGGPQEDGVLFVTESLLLPTATTSPHLRPKLLSLSSLSLSLFHFFIFSPFGFSVGDERESHLMLSFFDTFVGNSKIDDRE